MPNSPFNNQSLTVQGSLMNSTLIQPIRGVSIANPIDFEYECNPVYMKEQHTTVIRRGPTMPPQLEMYSWDLDADVNSDTKFILDYNFFGNEMLEQAVDGSPVGIFHDQKKNHKKTGDIVWLPIDTDLVTNADAPDWFVGGVVIITYEFTDSSNVIQRTSCRLQILNTPVDHVDGPNGNNSNANLTGKYVKCKILSIGLGFPIEPDLNSPSSQIFRCSLVKKEPVFEFKFPKFAYRYQYEDGEYSTFSPWSETAFIPGEFDYLPKKGFNLGMTNRIRSLKVLNWRPKNIPKDVVKVDILYKESNSPNVYTVESFKKTDIPSCNACENAWNTRGIGDNFGRYNISSELIHQVVASNQLLRVWDNVPRKAAAQEITANRIVYGNYLQNYNLIDYKGSEIKPQFEVDITQVDHSSDIVSVPGPFDINVPKQPMKSLKSMRTYQLGVVYRDRYGRETPVLSSKSGSFEIPRKSAKFQNKLNVKLDSNPPHWAESYTFYIKETSNEYYNIALDRWYDAEDGNIWLSFPSSERNKVTDETILILKKQHDSNNFVDSEVKYRVLAIENDAPNFIKTDMQYWGAISMNPSPPGWGTDGRPGNPDSGMFFPTGLPLPGSLYIDVYAEYFDQSVLAGLREVNAAQLRVVQSSQTSSYINFASDQLNKSKWYDISKVNYIGAPPRTYTETTTDIMGNPIVRDVEEPGQEERIVRITLEELMGEDMSFCSPDDALPPTNLLSLDIGISIEARAQTIRERPQFQGRFFVKVLRDADLETHIIAPQERFGDIFQVVMSRKLKYINMAHPGTQDWRTDETDPAVTYGSTQAIKGKWYGGHSGVVESNYLPPAIDPDPGISSGSNEAFYNNWDGTGSYGYVKRFVSSLSFSAGEAPYKGVFPTGAQVGPFGYSGPPSDPNYYWPIGPGYHSSHVYDPNSPWGEYPASYAAYISGNGISTNPLDGNTPFFKVSSDTHSPWPAFMTDQWSPNTIATPHSLWYNIGGGPAFIPPVNSIFDYSMRPDIFMEGVDTTVISTPIYQAQWDPGVELKLPFNAQNGLDVIARTPPANPYQIPEIWGDQSDFQNVPAQSLTAVAENEDTLHKSLSDQTRDPKNNAIFNQHTIEKLRKDWYYLYHGQQKMDPEWPNAHIPAERWFIDKCGAAKGYSGNGMWTTNVAGNIVTRMHVSYYGIGDPTTNIKHRSHDMLHFNDEEHAFAELMSTTGTMFRYRSDPDQIVYTITNVSGPEKIYNYEAPHGVWGYTDPDAPPPPPLTIGGGGGIGEGKKPPYGETTQGATSIANKDAFFSDVFNRDSEAINEEDTGGYFINYRLRWTITLDKEVGAGLSGFHPLTNHVDENGNCNIEGTPSGAKYYFNQSAGTNPNGFGSQEYFPKQGVGGMNEAVRMYNLSSYWNYHGSSVVHAANGEDQNSSDGDGNVNGQHFGLHERGINDTWIEVVTPYRGDEAKPLMSSNPAIFETEPREDLDVDLYYAASPTYPINLKRFRHDDIIQDPIDFHWNPEGEKTGAHWHDYGLRGEEYIPVGSRIILISSLDGQSSGTTCMVTGVEANRLWVSDVLKIHSGSGDPMQVSPGDVLRITWQGEGFFFGGQSDPFSIDEVVVKDNTGIVPIGDIYSFYIEPDIHKNKITLPYHNCYSFANGVESNRIRDDFNAVQIDKGVKASMPLAEKYMEEKRGSSLIYSGIYNSTSSINRTNQFIQGEKITKEINPIHGTIQKLHTRDTDLVTFCENKVFKILANKDAVFNADGNTNLTATDRVLGQVVPFLGEYGISKNPESFAQQSQRVYFADKTRGSILRLSQDGLTPISELGMKDWFKDYLRYAEEIIGSYDDRKDEYNLSIRTKKYSGDDHHKLYTLSFTESSRGWVSFKSFVHQGGISHNNVYYTFPYNWFEETGLDDPWGIGYEQVSSGGFVGRFSVHTPEQHTGNIAEVFQHDLDLEVKKLSAGMFGANSAMGYTCSQTDWPNIVDPCAWISFQETDTSDILIGMNVEGNGIPTGTQIIQKHIISPGFNEWVKLSTTEFNIDDGQELTFTTSRNTFYNVAHPSSVKLLFNGDPSSVKEFKTLNYEGTQASVTQDITNRHELHGAGGTVDAGVIYNDNLSKDGWFVNSISTDMQKGSLKHFKNKENKWFDYIKGEAEVGAGDDIDTGNFPVQGLGFVRTLVAPGVDDQAWTEWFSN